MSLGSSIDPDAISEGNDVYMDCEIRANPRVYKVEWSHNVSFTGYSFLDQLRNFLHKLTCIVLLLKDFLCIIMVVMQILHSKANGHTNTFCQFKCI